MGLKDDIELLRKEIEDLKKRQTNDDEKFICLERKYDRAVDLLENINKFGKWIVGIIIAAYGVMKVLTSLDG